MICRIHLAGGALHTLHFIAKRERRFGKPVVTTNQATMWASFNALGGDETLSGDGRLLEKGEK